MPRHTEELTEVAHALFEGCLQFLDRDFILLVSLLKCLAARLCARFLGPGISEHLLLIIKSTDEALFARRIFSALDIEASTDLLEEIIRGSRLRYVDDHRRRLFRRLLRDRNQRQQHDERGRCNEILQSSNCHSLAFCESTGVYGNRLVRESHQPFPPAIAALGSGTRISCGAACFLATRRPSSIQFA